MRMTRVCVAPRTSAIDYVYAGSYYDVLGVLVNAVRTDKRSTELSLGAK
jgi:hypothetical protein